MPIWMKWIWEAAYNLSLDQKQKVVRFSILVFACALVAVLSVVGYTALSEAHPENPLWEIVILYRLAIAKLVLSLVLMPVGFFVGLTMYQIFEASQLGKRLVLWKDKTDIYSHPEPVSVCAAKTRNGGFILGCLAFGCIIGLMMGVLK